MAIWSDMASILRRAHRLPYTFGSPTDEDLLRFTRLHAYDIDDLVDIVYHTCCREDQTKLTERQKQAKAEFLKVFSSGAAECTEEEMVNLLGLLDTVFFAGALTQRQSKLWRQRQPGMQAYAEHDHPLSSKSIIHMSRVFGGRRFTRTQMVNILSHEMVHSFIALYWDWCPNEDRVFVDGIMDSHGPVFWTMANEIQGTIDGWHPDLNGMGLEGITAP
ncbi:hypothetical protein GGR52DRAFT_575198 [Hypoxylon sp. FL1284]|nr:hypothetical protein GGR52DRAFT_575198 [Hypoxylon sp. FL1284]